MKKTAFLITILTVCLIVLNACQKMAAPNSTASNEKPKTIETANKSNVSLKPAETKTPTEQEIKNGSVKSDDYEKNSDGKAKSSNVCDTEAYVIDKDPNGLNIRDSAERGNVIGKIPFDEDGTIVHLISTNFIGWVQIDRAETVDGTVVFDKKGWVAANLLATSTTGYGGQGVELTEAGAGTKMLTFIAPETEVRIYSCDGKSVRVKYEKYTGWLNAEQVCPNPVTNCS